MIAPSAPPLPGPGSPAVERRLALLDEGRAALLRVGRAEQLRLELALEREARLERERPARLAGPLDRAGRQRRAVGEAERPRVGDHVVPEGLRGKHLIDKAE